MKKLLASRKKKSLKKKTRKKKYVRGLGATTSPRFSS